MIIKASDMLAVGELDDNAVFYDDKTQVFYLGKSLKTVDVKQMGLTGVQVKLTSFELLLSPKTAKQSG